MYCMYVCMYGCMYVCIYGNNLGITPVQGGAPVRLLSWFMSGSTNAEGNYKTIIRICF